MQVSLDDARFFCEKIGQIVRGQSEQEQDLKVVHRYFRAYLHCWKCVFDYVREEKGLKETASFRSQCSRLAASKLNRQESLSHAANAAWCSPSGSSAITRGFRDGWRGESAS